MLHFKDVPRSSNVFFVKLNIMCFMWVEALAEMFSLVFVQGKVIVESNRFLSANLLKDLLRAHSLTWCSWWKSICSVYQTAAGRFYSPAVELSYSGPCTNNACLSLFESGCFLLLLCNSSELQSSQVSSGSKAFSGFSVTLNPKLVTFSANVDRGVCLCLSFSESQHSAPWFCWCWAVDCSLCTAPPPDIKFQSCL